LRKLPWLFITEFLAVGHMREGPLPMCALGHQAAGWTTLGIAYVEES
jgi:hypothetical protein